MNIKVEKTSYNLLGVLGCANVLLALIALTPALFGYIEYNVYGGILGLLVGGVLITYGRPLKTVKSIVVPVDHQFK